MSRSISNQAYDVENIMRNQNQRKHYELYEGFNNPLSVVLSVNYWTSVPRENLQTLLIFIFCETSSLYKGGLFYHNRKLALPFPYRRVYQSYCWTLLQHYSVTSANLTSARKLKLLFIALLYLQGIRFDNESLKWISLMFFLPKNKQFFQWKVSRLLSLDAGLYHLVAILQNTEASLTECILYETSMM